MAKLMGVDLVPLHVPLTRRLQTFVVVCYALTFTVWPLVCIGVCVSLLFTRFYWLPITYSMWIFYDVVVAETSSRGGRSVDWIRRNRVWHYFRDYFPIELIKCGDLDPKHNYIMGYHPHGIITCGCTGNFAADATGFSKKYPGIKSYPMTLQANFRLPFLRGFLLWMGICDVSKESITYIVGGSKKGNAAVIVVGGAEEALEAHPGNYNLKLKHRKGFIKMAIKTGAHLVPIYSFGENDLFVQMDNPKGSTLRQFQEKFKKTFGFSPPVFHGRGVFNYTFGFLPYRKPIHTVVGAPIEVTQNETPGQEDIDNYHNKYLEELKRIFDEYKIKYGIDKDVKLNFI